MTVNYKLVMGNATIVEGTLEDIIEAVKNIQAMQPKKSLFRSIAETSYNMGKTLLEEKPTKNMGKKKHKKKR